MRFEVTLSGEMVAEGPCDGDGGDKGYFPLQPGAVCRQLPWPQLHEHPRDPPRLFN